MAAFGNPPGKLKVVDPVAPKLIVPFVPMKTLVTVAPKKLKLNPTGTFPQKLSSVLVVELTVTPVGKGKIKAPPPTKAIAFEGGVIIVLGAGIQTAVKFPALKPEPIVALVPGQTP